MAKKDTRRVVAIKNPDGTITRRLATVCRPDRRRSDFINKVHRGDIRGPTCPGCHVFHSWPCPC